MSTLVLAVCLKLFFPPIDTQQALLIVQHTQCPCRFVILLIAAKALQSQASRQTYIYFANASRYHVNKLYTHACGIWVVFLEHGGGALGIFKSPMCTYSHDPLCASHYFSFISQRSGRRIPPAERSALYPVLCCCTTYQVLYTCHIFIQTECCCRCCCSLCFSAAVCCCCSSCCCSSSCAEWQKLLLFR